MGNDRFMHSSRPHFHRDAGVYSPMATRNLYWASEARNILALWKNNELPAFEIIFSLLLLTDYEDTTGNGARCLSVYFVYLLPVTEKKKTKKPALPFTGGDKRKAGEEVREWNVLLASRSQK